MNLVSPSILSADFMNLEKEISMLNESSADWIHIDVMDGCFVPNITIGMPIVKQLKRVATKPLDVHLMIVQPHKYIEQFIKAGSEILTIHYEASANPQKDLQEIRKLGSMAGISIKPNTEAEVLEPLLLYIDVILVMSVEPGFGGQSFIPHSVEKVETLRKMIDNKNLDIRIEVDGGINLETGKQIVDAGADVLVAGAFVFGSQNPTETIQSLKF